MERRTAIDTTPDPAEAQAVRPAPVPAIRSAFGSLLGVLSRRPSGDGHVHGVVAEERLANEAGVVHGGAITALFDEILGSYINDALGRPHVTVQLSTVFLRPVMVGDFIEFGCEIVDSTRSMTFVEGRLIVRGVVVAKAQMIFKARRAGSGEGA